MAYGLISILSEYGESAMPATRISNLTDKIKANLSSDTNESKKIQNRKVSAGDTIYDILRKNGFSDTQRNLALAQSSIPRGFVLAPGDIYQVVKVADAKRLEINFFDRFANMAYAFWKGTEDAGADIKENILRAETATVSGKIKGSLIQSIQNLVGDEMLAYRFMDAYLMDYNMKKDIQRNAAFKITYQKLYSGKHFIRLGEVLHAELEIGNENIVRDFLPLDKGGIFLGGLNNHASRPLYAPVDYIRISSLFQPRRYHPVKKRRIAHMGVDFELPEGEDIFAVQDGVVVRSGRNRASGNYVVLRHKNGLESYYNHMSSISRMIYPGLNVKVGSVVGKIGCTGYCTKPHLHLALKKYGRFVDPLPYLKRYSYSQRKEGTKLAR